RARACLTWGTSTTRLAGPEHFAPPVVLAALDGLDIDVVVAVTGADADAIGEPPPGIRVVRDLPLHLVLPHCAVLIHQGGNGTLLTGAYYGIPQLVLPHLPDQTFHAERFVATGAGLCLLPVEADPGAIRAAVRDLLDAPRY